MISPKEKKVKNNNLDTVLTHRLKNWSGRTALPTNGKQRLFSAVIEYDRLDEARQTNFLLRYLPTWLQSYLLNSNHVTGKSEDRGYKYNTSYKEMPDIFMTNLYGAKFFSLSLYRYL